MWTFWLIDRLQACSNDHFHSHHFRHPSLTQSFVQPENVHFHKFCRPYMLQLLVPSKLPSRIKGLFWFQISKLVGFLLIFCLVSCGKLVCTISFAAVSFRVVSYRFGTTPLLWARAFDAATMHVSINDVCVCMCVCGTTFHLYTERQEH